MLKTSWKQNSVLLIFALIMHEILTPVTMSFVGLGLVLTALNVKTPKLARNILALGVFASYWLTYGKIIDPEVGLNFLTSIIVIKILERETTRDRYMIFFGLILLISAGALFEKTLTYVIFFGISFLVLLGDFYQGIGEKWRPKDLLWGILWVLPLTLVMFFVVPRMLSPIPFNQETTEAGEVGYTPDVNISSIDSLTSNQSPVFQVQVTRAMNPEELYWRGNTLSYTDGWNWSQMGQDQNGATPLLGAKLENLEVGQKFRLYTRPEYFFALDAPRVISYGKEFLGLGRTSTLPQKRWRWIQRYEVMSLPRGKIEDGEVSKSYLRVPFSEKVKKEIHQKFPGKNLPEIEESIRGVFLREGFSYSLSPGRSHSFQEFMKRKNGFCSHYASALALILRAKGIPARLVSGYLGGHYNPYAGLYLVTQNDAHVWVEAQVGGKWLRLDPTSWVAPERVRLGGAAYVESVQEGARKRSGFLGTPRFIQELKMWFGQWDFLFYQWLEEMDYHAQESWLSRFKLKRQWLISIIPLVMVVFMLGYSWFLKSRNAKEKPSPYQEVWQLFYQRLERKNIHISRLSLSEAQTTLENLTGNNRDLILEIWEELITASFQRPGDSLLKTKKKIKKI